MGPGVLRPGPTTPPMRKETTTLEAAYRLALESRYLRETDGAEKERIRRELERLGSREGAERR